MRAARAFVEAGARATDHGHLLADTSPMEATAAGELYSRILGGADASGDEVVAFAANMLYQMAQMSCDDGLVMQIHPGVLRDHNSTIWRSYGSDKGYDIPIQTEFTRALDRCWTGSGPIPGSASSSSRSTRLYSRAGPDRRHLPSVRLGAPWWFLDSLRACAASGRRLSRLPASTTHLVLWTTRGRTRPYPLAMTSSAASMPAISRGWSWNIGSTSTRPSRQPST